MGYGKWIGAFIGVLNSGSILGALAGFALGSIMDMVTGNRDETETIDTGSQEDGNRNRFLFSLMVLSAHIIGADGRIMHSEMEMVRAFLRNSFGEEAVTQGNDILLKLFDYRKKNGENVWREQIGKACDEMYMVMQEEHRIQLMAYLADIVKADGNVSDVELTAMREIAARLRLNVEIVDQLFALGGDSLEDAYKVLGVSPEASDDEVKKAYKDMVRKNHPDRVASLGEDVKEAATLKLQEINDAKERIFKSRGL
ncbi:MAG: DnaJ domain-containing protein [Bacteroidaceae bacterium]|nr:DnaJ domain-containing protein [Bacteroidaceae bacterium]